MKYSIQLFVLSLLLGFSTIDGSAKAEPGFITAYNDFKNLKTLVFNATFKTVGKREGKSVDVDGRFILEKREFDLLKFKSFSLEEVGYGSFQYLDEVIYDGTDFYKFDSDEGKFVNKGSLHVIYDGIKRTRTSAFLYANLVIWYEEFNRNSNSVIYNSTEGGYTFTLPSYYGKESIPIGAGGEVIMFFTHGSKLPYQVVAYDTQNNSEDYIVLSLSSVRTDLTIPPSFFQVPKTSDIIANRSGSANTTKSELENLKARQEPLLTPGSTAPEWTLKDSNGNVRKLSDYKGKVVVLDFWATRCKPCVMAQPTLQNIHDTYKDQNVVVLGMDCNDKADIDLNEYKLKKNLTYEMILDAEKFGEAYKITALPTAYVIDKSGKIIYAAKGLSEKTEKALIDAIDMAIK